MNYQYRLSKCEPLNLSMRERILLFLYDRDIRSGRDGKTDSEHSLSREAFFMFCTTLIHSRELTFLSIIKWDELDDLNTPDVPEDLQPKLPLGHTAVARIGNGVKRRFSNAVRSLHSEGNLHGFYMFMRALQGGYMEKCTPQLSLWSKESSFSNIVAISLTTKGFREAENIAKNNTVLLPWQIHPRMVKDEKLMDMLLKKNL